MKKQNEEDLFLSFLIKEQEIAYINKIHAQTSIRYMGQCFKEKENNATLFKRILWNIRDFFILYYLDFISYKNKLKIKNLTDDDKKTKIIIHKRFKHNNFKIHFFLIRRFQIKTLIDDSGCVDISNFEFDSYIRIEYNEIISQPHLKETFKKEQDAVNYFNELLLNKKKKNGITLIRELENKMDEEFVLIKKRIEFLKNKLLNE